MQRSATKLNADARQLHLLSEPAPAPSRPVDLEYLMMQPSVGDAIEYAGKLAGKVPKHLYLAMKKDKSVWSRICSGEIGFPADDIKKFCAVVGNDALSLWVAHDNGWDIRAMRKAMNCLERENFELRRQIAEKDRALEIAVQLVSGRVPR
jgi:hypothetical protein